MSTAPPSESAKWACPHCATEIHSSAVRCEACGEDVGMPVLAEDESPDRAPTPRPPVPVDAFTVPPPASGPPASTAPHASSLGTVLLAMAVMLAVAAAAGVAVTAQSGDDDTGAGESSIRRASAGPGRDASLHRSRIRPGRYVRLASMRTRATATDLARDLRRSEVPAFVMDSDHAKELLPSFYVVLAGPTGPERAPAFVRRARRVGITDAFVAPLSPASATLRAGDLAGGWSGTMRQAGARRPENNRDLPVRVSIDGDGRAGTVRYPDIPCSAVLSLEASAATVATYRESVVSGRCADAGTWSFKLIDGRLGGTWRVNGQTAFVVGFLDRR